MKVVHCLGWYFPDTVGGTETYVSGLARVLRERGVEVVVMAPRDGHEEARYEHEGVTVLRYPVVLERSRDQHLGRVAHGGFDRFVSLLAAEQADVFHLHSHSYGSNVHHVRAARQLGMRAFATAHVPSFVCPRGTMMRMGESACDGLLAATQCVPCTAQSRGLHKLGALALSPALRRVPTRMPLPPGRAGSVLSLAASVAQRREGLLELAEHCDAVVALCVWLRDALAKNGVPAHKLVLQRQGVEGARLPLSPLRHASPSEPLRIGYFGRASVVKGLGTLTAAVEALPASVPIELRAYAVANDLDERTELQALHDAASRDARIVPLPPVPPAHVAETMRGHDVIAVPSRWLETGPLVAMEALVAGVPVLGSDLGGLRELVREGENGWLEPAGNVERWRTRLEQLARGQGALRVGSLAHEVPTVGAVVDTMLALYGGSQAR